jgi:hypothetical protein
MTAQADGSAAHDYGAPYGAGYIAQAEHTLRISAWCSIAGVTLALAAVVIDECGQPRPHLNTLVPTSDRIKTTSASLPLECGAIASVHVFASGGTPLGCQCYVRVELLQGREGGVQSLGTILEGYVTANVALAYPGDNTSRATDGRGTFRIILGAVPAAGAEIIETVPANTRWQLVAFRFRITASAGANIVFETENVTAVTAAQVVTYNAGAGIQNANLAALDYQLALPETLVLPAGARIRTLTGLIQGADQYAAPVYNVEEWLDV